MPHEPFSEQAALHVRTLFNEPGLSADLRALFKDTVFSPRHIGPSFYPLEKADRFGLLRDTLLHGRSLLSHSDPAAIQAGDHFYFTYNAGRPVGTDPIRYIEVPAGTHLTDPDGKLFMPDTSFALPAHAAHHYMISRSIQDPNRRNYSGLMAMKALEEMLTAHFIMGELQRDEPAFENAPPSFSLVSVEPVAEPLEGLSLHASGHSIPDIKTGGARVGILLATPFAIAALQEDHKNLRQRFAQDAALKRAAGHQVMPIIARFPGLVLSERPHPQLSLHRNAMMAPTPS